MAIKITSIEGSVEVSEGEGMDDICERYRYVRLAASRGCDDEYKAVTVELSAEDAVSLSDALRKYAELPT